MVSLDTGSDVGRDARLLAVEVADEPASWARAGFIVTDRRVRVGDTDIVLVGARPDGRGILTWTLAGLHPPAPAGDGLQAAGGGARPSSLDGLPTTFVGAVDRDPSDADTADCHRPTSSGDGLGPSHPNGVVGLDHVVVSSPDLARTTAALGWVGLARRRVRETTARGAPVRQAFFRLGPTVLEVISGETDSGVSSEDAPATWFGLAFDAADLDRTSAVLGDDLGSIRDAVQDGRRIATLRHRSLGLSVAVAVMDDHGGR